MGFWQHHGILFLVGITVFPRLTLLLGTSLHFGLLSWLGWVFTPHLLVAILATTLYWKTDPVLCVIAWAVALGGTSGEAKGSHHFVKRKRARRE